MSEPTKGEWGALYQAAIAFRQAAPWEWMDNEDLYKTQRLSKILWDLLRLPHDF